MNGLMSGVGSRAPTGLGSSGGGWWVVWVVPWRGVCFRIRLSLLRKGMGLDSVLGLGIKKPSLSISLHPPIGYNMPPSAYPEHNRSWGSLVGEFPGGLYWDYIYVSILILTLSIIRSFSATWQMFFGLNPSLLSKNPTSSCSSLKSLPN